MRPIRYLLLTLSCLLPLALSAQRTRPDILVQIYVKGLRTDLLASYRAGWGGNGLNGVMKHGTVAPDIRSPYPLLDEVARLASLSAGAMPEIHGVYQAERYDAVTQRSESTFANRDYRGINSTEQLAPAGALRSELLTDVLRGSSQGDAIVYAIASRANDAIAVAGHDAEGAIWIDKHSGWWATTNFYGGLPALALKANNEQRMLGGRTTPTVWKPLSKGAKEGSFAHTFEGAWRMSDLLTSPFANDAVTDLSKEFIRYAHKARRTSPTLIVMVLDLEVGARGVAYADYSPEQQDAYARLNEQVHQITALLQELYGADHYALNIVGVPVANLAQPKAPSRRSVVTFDPAKCIALANLYLSAIYGRNDWVMAYSHQTLHLNKKEIADKKVDMQDMSNNLATFVSEMEGVIGAIPAYQLQRGLSQPAWAKPLYSHSYRSYAGDVLLALAPFAEVAGEKPGVEQQRQRHVTAPFILMAPGVASQRLTEPISYDAVAPSLAYLLCVPQPMSADGTPLFILFNQK